MKRYEKYGRNPSWIVKWFWKYRRKLWNDMENIEERQVEMWNDKRLEAFSPVKPTGLLGSYQILLK